jgi:hypothetical protein
MTKAELLLHISESLKAEQTRLEQLVQAMEEFPDEPEVKPQWQPSNNPTGEVFFVNRNGQVTSESGINCGSAVVIRGFNSLELAESESKRRRAERTLVAAIERCNIRNGWKADFSDENQNKNYIVWDATDVDCELGFFSTENDDNNLYQSMPIQFYFGCNLAELQEELRLDDEGLSGLVRDWLQL